MRSGSFCIGGGPIGQTRMPLRHSLDLLDPAVAPLLVPAETRGPAQPIPLLRPITFIGDRAEAHVRVHGHGISTLHAVLVVEKHGAWVRDLASRTGTFINNQIVREFPLRHGDLLRIGSESYRFSCDGSGFDFPAGLMLVESPTESEPIPWSGRVFSIGRREGADLRIDDTRVSLTHAVICRIAGRCYLCDAGSRRGTFLNKVRVHQIEVLPGDTIQVGKVPIRLAAPAWGRQPARVARSSTSNAIQPPTGTSANDADSVTGSSSQLQRHDPSAVAIPVAPSAQESSGDLAAELFEEDEQPAEPNGAPAVRTPVAKLVTRMPRG